MPSSLFLCQPKVFFLTFVTIVPLLLVGSFVPQIHNKLYSSRNTISLQHRAFVRPLRAIYIIASDDDDNADDEEDDDEEEEEEEEEDPYTKTASEEFVDKAPPGGTSALSRLSETPTTAIDWGGALGKLRQRLDDVESGKAKDPSHVLFRLMSSQTPNQLIGKFVQSTNPQVVQAMSGAVSSLLGGLSNPIMGIETVVKASGEKIGSLCFQLQMTGYMFRNAEYVLALKDLMNLRGSATLEDYKAAFRRLDTDGSGYIESDEIRDLLDDVYDGQAPDYEIDAFLSFFDKNKDGRISWNEFEKGLGAAMAQQREKKDAALNLLSKDKKSMIDDDEDDDDEPLEVSADVSGMIEIELEDGKVVEVEAKEYIEGLKKEAQALKEALRRENSAELPPQEPDSSPGAGFLPAQSNIDDDDDFGGSITEYIASRQGDVKSLTEGISPEVMEAMKLLVDFVLEGGESGKGKRKPKASKTELEMELPGSALQQLALWQLVLGYKLREMEAKGDYLKLLK